MFIRLFKVGGLALVFLRDEELLLSRLSNDNTADETTRLNTKNLFHGWLIALFHATENHGTQAKFASSDHEGHFHNSLVNRGPLWCGTLVLKEADQASSITCDWVLHTKVLDALKVLDTAILFNCIESDFGDFLDLLSVGDSEEINVLDIVTCWREEGSLNDGLQDVARNLVIRIILANCATGDQRVESHVKSEVVDDVDFN